jgi:hypothetical protein
MDVFVRLVLFAQASNEVGATSMTPSRNPDDRQKILYTFVAEALSKALLVALAFSDTSMRRTTVVLDRKRALSRHRPSSCE